MKSFGGMLKLIRAALAQISHLFVQTSAEKGVTVYESKRSALEENVLLQALRHDLNPLSGKLFRHMLDDEFTVVVFEIVKEDREEELVLVLNGRALFRLQLQITVIADAGEKGTGKVAVMRHCSRSSSVRTVA